MEFRIIYLPPFQAAVSEVDTICDFSPDSILGKFEKYFSAIQPSAKESFMPRDFLFYDEEKNGMVWMWALTEDNNHGGYSISDFDGGYYLTYTYKDGDSDADATLRNMAMEYIKNSNEFELDIRPGHYIMGHIITPPEISKIQGWDQMETFIPIKLK